MNWKKGRGKLGLFQPLLGEWQAEAQSDLGHVTCRRVFRKVLDAKYIQLTANWLLPSGSYQEIALIGVTPEKEIRFWSFTSDGKHAQGWLADVSDIHPQAIGFESQMPAGLGRMAYWPDPQAGYRWVVEAQTKKGWRRFLEHHYQPVGESQVD